MRALAITTDSRQILDTFEIDNEFQARKKLACFGFAHFGDRSGDFLVHATLHAVEFFFAIFNGKVRHVRGILDEVAKIKRRICCHKTRLQDNASERSRGFGFNRG